MTLEANTVFDAFDRPVQSMEKHLDGAGNSKQQSRCTIMSYFGLGSQLSQEERRPAAAPCSIEASTTTRTKSYGYDTTGQRITMSDKVGSVSPTEHTYAYDPHGSVSSLLNSSGTVRSSYGYLPYGDSDRNADGDPDENPDGDRLTYESDPSTGQESDKNDPFNAYRYSGKRLDAGSGTLDMGARRLTGNVYDTTTGERLGQIIVRQGG